MFWYVLLSLNIHIHLHLLLHLPYSSTCVLQVIACFHNARGLCEKSKYARGMDQGTRLRWIMHFYSIIVVCDLYNEGLIQASNQATTVVLLSDITFMKWLEILL